MEHPESRPPTASPTPEGASPATLRETIARERVFLLALAGLFVAAAAAAPYPRAAMWLGFTVAAYAAVGNDSIQTIGTFIASNKAQRWWTLWLFIGGIFLVTVTYSWLAFDGDVSYGRLGSKGFDTAPASFTYLQVAAPIFLLMLTRLRMPVSTTFLLLTSFATSVSGVGKVLIKSVSGYAIAFVLAMVVWLALTRIFERSFAREKPHPLWRPAQWLTSGALWSVWIMQDAANIAVYLPRSLAPVEFLLFSGIVFFGLGLLFYARGERIQQIVEEKSNVVDVRPATIIDLVYAAILVYHLYDSKTPMSTTFVFIGLLGGRELAMSLRSARGRGWPEALRMMGKDLLFAFIGLVVSVALAAAVNPLFYDQVVAFVGG